MKRFVEGTDRGQSTLFPESLEDWIGEDNAVRVVDVFVEELDLAGLGFDGVDPEATGRPSYHPSVLLKLYIYGYLNRVQSSRRLMRACHSFECCARGVFGSGGWSLHSCANRTDWRPVQLKSSPRRRLPRMPPSKPNLNAAFEVE